MAMQLQVEAVIKREDLLISRVGFILRQVNHNVMTFRLLVFDKCHLKHQRRNQVAQ